MKKFNEIGLVPIKCQNKVGTDKLKELHYSLNDVLFKYQMRYMLSGLISLMEKKLIDYGKQINELEVPSTAEAKKRELIEKIRSYILLLRQNKQTGGFTISTDEKTATEAIQKYCLSNYLKNKETLTTEQIITILEDNKELYDNGINKYPLQSFQKMQEELINKLKEKYEI